MLPSENEEHIVTVDVFFVALACLFVLPDYRISLFIFSLSNRIRREKNC